jgi:fido (protein-threonine AMPylation protein)
VEISKAVVDRIGREAAVETGAIEDIYGIQPGDSLTVANMEDGWELVFQRDGFDALPVFASQLEAYEYVRLAAERELPVTQKFIRELHAISCRSQEFYEVRVPFPGGYRVEQRPLRHGDYKDLPNNVMLRDGTTRWYAPVDLVDSEMVAFVSELCSDEFTRSQAVVKAAYAHYCLTHIHPFSDGNGRVARALASYYVYQVYGLPVVVYADRKRTYLQALEAADKNRVLDLVRHMEDRVSDSLGRALLEVRHALRGSSLEGIREVVGAVELYGSISPINLEIAGKGLLGKVLEYLDQAIVRLMDEAGDAVEIRRSIGGGTSRPSLNDYQSIDYAPIWMATSRPVESRFDGYIAVFRASETSQNFQYIVAVARDLYIAYPTRAVEIVRMRYEDVWPELSASMIARISLLVDSALRWMLDNLKQRILDSVRHAGEESV